MDCMEVGVYSQAGDGECSQGFIKSTNHDTAFTVPDGLRAAISQRRTGIPNQEGKPESPQNGIEAVEREVNFRRKRA
jgi:hypothetical protein